MSAADVSGPADPQARETFRRHLASAAEATAAATGLALMARQLDAAGLDSASGCVIGWTPYTRDNLFLALELLAAAANRDIVAAGRADGFDVEHGFVDYRTAPAADSNGFAA